MACKKYGNKMIRCLIGNNLFDIVDYMTNLINILIQNSTFPDFWKHGKISPIHKSGDRFAANNYRPVCVANMDLEVNLVQYLQS